MIISKNSIYYFGDIADRGKELSFAAARDNLSLMQEEPKDCALSSNLSPAIMILKKGSLSLHDQLTSLYSSKHTFESASVYSNVHDNEQS